MNEILSEEKQNMIVDAIVHATAMHQEVIRGDSSESIRPSVLYKPKLGREGNQWGVLYGDNLQDGVAGFGKSPDAAMRDFDNEWIKNLD